MAIARGITIEQFERMIVEGSLPSNLQIELIKGELREMPPIGPDHAGSVASLHFMLQEKLGRSAYVWSQLPIQLPGQTSRPQPDVSVLRWQDDLYRGRLPGPEDVLLVIEVADTSLEYDRRTKAALYAEAGIPEYWLLDLRDKNVEIYSQPTTEGYTERRIALRGEKLSLAIGIQGTLEVDAILG
jgi:Uma2 family endonuclease